MTKGGRIGEENVDEKTAKGEGNAEAQVAEAAVYLYWSDNARSAGLATARRTACKVHTSHCCSPKRQRAVGERSS